MISDHQNLRFAREAASTRSNLIEFESSKFDTPAVDLRLQIGPNAFACIIYTSGSTGQPKGVAQNHRNLLHTIMLRARDSQICQYDKVSDLTSGTANSIFDALSAFLNGAVLLPFDVRKEGVNALAGWLVEERISLCWMSSRLFRTLCQTLTGAERFPDLRFIRLRSEPAYKSDVDLYRKYFSSDCTFGNGLSSTETGYLRLYSIDHNLPLTGDELPVGYAVEGKEIFLLDDGGKEIGFNEIGEIVVRSRYLSPGYWRRPDLTQAKFKPDPKGSDKRLYFTGDLGLMLPDGCLIHKGRKDFRVKIRGYGVEIAEIEKALFGHTAIKEAVVVAQQNNSGEDRLVAYITCSSQRNANINELRNFLKVKLPDYMIPSVFIKLEALPLMPNGKVDRRALPYPGTSRPKLDTPYVSARTSVEEQLAQIWARVLSLDEVGIHDNFFDLGGHSLAATRVVSQVMKQFQLEIPLQSLFQAPTIAEMANVITEHQGKKLGERELDHILAELETLSEEEAQRLLDDQTRTEHGKPK